MVNRLEKPFLRALLLLCVLLGSPLRVAAAHPIHMSFTEARYVDRNGTMQMWVRVFANDFAAAAARRSGIRLSRDSVIDPAIGAAYLTRNLQLVREDGHAVNLILCGVKRVNDMLSFCLQATAPEGMRKLKMRNSVMTELFGDQVNVVQTVDGSRRASRLFVQGDGLKPLP
ncbi:MAG TPA: DUF6702 family protein [Gemmatimonadaceae bacterium]|nr:DUF6702 family protein [Gemmatimonadaceae bacterium]